MLRRLFTHMSWLALVIWFVAGCTVPRGENGPVNMPSLTPNRSTAIYTPIIVLPPGTLMPAGVLAVDLADLIQNPERYADKFVEVIGKNGLAYTRPACYPYFGPPTQWLLLADNGNIQVRGPSTEAYSSPTGPDGRFVRDIWNKKLAVRAWVRLYEGGVGCGYQNGQGTPEAKDTKRVWYLDAVQAQYLESVEPQPTR